MVSSTNYLSSFCLRLAPVITMINSALKAAKNEEYIAELLP